ncbi:Uncharacterized protein HA466_0079890 [Hirschfeldia incana]|nr:Uncharacterized protein HA466_0079890 [Hirschfeldia incana]
MIEESIGVGGDGFSPGDASPASVIIDVLIIFLRGLHFTNFTLGKPSPCALAKRRTLIKISKLGFVDPTEEISLNLMEAAAKERTGLLDKILPPALADAGLEDCALPPDSIHEAFRKAADAVKSRAASLFEHDEEEGGGGGCVADPRPETKETKPVLGGSDTIVVGGDNGGDAGPCLVGKGNEKMEDALVVVAGEGGGGEGKSCGDGLKDLDVEGVESSKGEKDQSEEEEEEEMKPILVEGFV